MAWHLAGTTVSQYIIPSYSVRKCRVQLEDRDKTDMVGMLGALVSSLEGITFRSARLTRDVKGRTIRGVAEVELTCLRCKGRPLIIHYSIR